MSPTETPFPSNEEPIITSPCILTKLCELRKNIKIPFQKLGIQYYLRNYTIMISSATNGCDLCAVVSKAARVLSFRRNHCTVDQAHERLCSQSDVGRRKCKVRGMFVPLGYSDSPLDPLNRKSLMERCGRRLIGLFSLYLTLDILPLKRHGMYALYLIVIFS
jgi:hypothetical protein